MHFTRTDNLRQKLLYLQCIQAVASAADYHDAVDTLVPLLEDLGRDEDQSEEVRLEVAVQLAALGMLILLPVTCMILLKSGNVHEYKNVPTGLSSCRQSFPSAAANRQVHLARLQSYCSTTEPSSLFAGG